MLQKREGNGKGKSVLLQAWRGAEGSRNLMFPDPVTMAREKLFQIKFWLLIFNVSKFLLETDNRDIFKEQLKQNKLEDNLLNLSIW